MIRGTLSITEGSLVWSPERAWSSLGASAFDVRITDVELIERTSVDGRRTGIILHARGGVEVWMLLAKDQASALSSSLSDDDAQG